MEKIFGNNITIKGSASEKIEIIPYGNQKQEKREGYNLVKINETSKTVNGIQIEINTNKEIKLSGTATDYTTIPTGDEFQLSAGDYTLVVFHNGITTGDTHFDIREGSTILASTYQATNAKVGLKQFTIDTEKTVKPVVYITNTGSISDTWKPMLLKGLYTIENLPTYEQYGVSPSPEYPSKIKMVGDNINEFNIADITENMYLNQTGTTGNSTVTNITGYLKMEANQKYTFSYEYETLANSTSNRGYCLYDLDKNVIEGGSIYSPTAKLLMFIPEQDCYIRIAYDKNCKKIKFEQGPKSPYSEYGKGCIEIKKHNSNLVDLNVAQNQGITYNNDGTVTINRNGGVYLRFAQTMFKAGIKYYQRFELVSGKIIFTESGQETTLAFRNINDTGWITRDTFTQSILAQDTERTGFWINAGVKFENAVIKIWVNTDKADFVPHQNQKEVLPIQEPMLEGDYIDETENHVWNKYVLTGEEAWSNEYGENLFSKHNLIPDIKQEESNLLCNYFIYNSIKNGINTNTTHGEFSVQLTTASGEGNLFFKDTRFSTVEDWKAWLKERYDSKNPVIVYYPLEKSRNIKLNSDQISKMVELQNMEFYTDITNITVTSGEVSPNMEITIKKQVEDYDFYISSTGHFVVPELDVRLLIDFSESSIPNMPEAVESSIRAAGRDGDYVLNTTYEPVNFNIVCYTDDNLTPQEKTLEEEKINYFLNSIKNKTKRMADERYGKFYNVKYNTSLVSVNYPKHVKFTIPLKSSESYGKKLMQKMIFGNGIVESKTVKEVGAVFTINGPALNPIISLNDYSMEYNMSILEGARIEIDSNKSTITHINAEGVRTNVMKYYNHQFPKIEYGKNELKVLSGVDDELNVNVKWYDLKL